MEIVTNNFEFLENGLGLSLVVFFPLVSAFIVAILPKKQELLIKLTALGSSLITFILSVIVVIFGNCIIVIPMIIRVILN